MSRTWRGWWRLAALMFGVSVFSGWAFGMGTKADRMVTDSTHVFLALNLGYLMREREREPSATSRPEGR